MQAENFPKLDEVVKTHVLSALDLAGGNKAKAAELLGVSIKTVYNHLGRYGLSTASRTSVSSSVESSSEVSSSDSEEVSSESVASSVSEGVRTALPTGSNNIFG